MKEKKRSGAVNIHHAEFVPLQLTDGPSAGAVSVIVRIIAVKIVKGEIGRSTKCFVQQLKS